MTRIYKAVVTPCVSRPGTVRDMDESWRDLDELWQRIRWARKRSAFDSGNGRGYISGVKPGTYRTWERPRKKKAASRPLPKSSAWPHASSRFLGFGSPLAKDATSELVADERRQLYRPQGAGHPSRQNGTMRGTRRLAFSIAFAPGANHPQIITNRLAGKARRVI